MHSLRIFTFWFQHCKREIGYNWMSDNKRSTHFLKLLLITQSKVSFLSLITKCFSFFQSWIFPLCLFQKEWETKRKKTEKIHYLCAPASFFIEIDVIQCDRFCFLFDFDSFYRSIITSFDGKKQIQRNQSRWWNQHDACIFTYMKL